jgi:hypothetical protein
MMDNGICQGNIIDLLESSVREEFENKFGRIHPAFAASGFIIDCERHNLVVFALTLRQAEMMMEGHAHLVQEGLWDE